MTTDPYKATKDGVADAWDDWLSQHPVSVPETVASAVKNAVNEWLNRHGDDLFRQAITDALRSRDFAPPGQPTDPDQADATPTTTCRCVLDREHRPPLRLRRTA